MHERRILSLGAPTGTHPGLQRVGDVLVVQPLKVGQQAGQVRFRGSHTVDHMSSIAHMFE